MIVIELKIYKTLNLNRRPWSVVPDTVSYWGQAGALTVSAHAQELRPLELTYISTKDG